MLAVSVAYALAAGISRYAKFEIPKITMCVIEILDTVVVLWLVFHCKMENFGGNRKVFAWVTALPTLASLLLGGVLFSQWKRSLVDPDAPEPTDTYDDETINFFEIVTTSIQPGVIEELFCRHLLQGVLLKLTGPHTAIFVAAAMFALLHLFNPLGLPYLFLAGVVLGYYRYWSGSLILPMTMHALHNFAIMIWKYLI